MPIPPNNLVGDAIDLGTDRPVTVVQTGITSGITTYAVWYTFTAQANDKVLGIWGFGALGGYQPQLTVYSDAGITTYLSGFPGVNVPVQVPVVPGNSYWLLFTSSTGFVATATLTLNLQRAPILNVPANSLFIPDDRDGYPAAFLNATDATVLQFAYPFPGGEGGDVLPTGEMLVEDTAAGNLKLYSASLSLLATITFPWTSGDPSIRSNKIDKFYVGCSRTVHGLINRFSSAGVLEDTWTLTSARIVGIAPSNDGGLIYVTGQGGTTSPVIKVWNTSTDSFDADLTAGEASHVAPEDLLVLDDDSIIAVFDKFTATKNTTLVQYDPTGTVLNLTDYGSAVAGVKSRLAYDPTDPGFFWLWRHTGSGDSQFARINATTFVESQVSTAVTYEQGVYQGSQTATPVRFGHSESCPFFFARGTVPPPITTHHDPIRFVRIFPHLNEKQLNLFVTRLEIELQRGVGLISGQGSDPAFLVSASHDGGMSYGPERFISPGKLGKYLARAKSERWGRARDWVYKLTITDPVLIALAAVYLDVEQGNS